MINRRKDIEVEVKEDNLEKEIVNIFDEVKLIDVNRKEIVTRINGRLNTIGKCEKQCKIKCETCLCEALNESSNRKTKIVFNNNKMYVAQAMKIENRERGKNLVIVTVSRIDKEVTFESKNNKELFDELKSFNRTLYRDKLTDVYNRNFLSDRIEKKFMESKQNNERFCIAAIDIDKFKSFNDTYGHDFGDEVLRYVAENMKKVAGSIEECYIVRIGGDEFNIIATNIKREKFIKKMEELRKNIEETKVRFKNKEASVKISVGTAELIEDTSNNYNELYKIADNRLYEAKEKGRNNVV